MKRLYLGIYFHENWLYSVGNRVTRVVNIVKELNKVPWKDVVVVVSVGRVPPAKTKEYRKRRTKAKEVFNSEYEPGLSSTRLRRLGSRMPVSSWSFKVWILLPLTRRTRHLN